ncbi:putative PNG1 protein [Rosellinia necatrix]|uniref:Putative PNG1 protein n=1 Tax=Rosellinia necatrix TaxID=77044 RepID=A0A1S7ULS0_ROSNE|nr:putative PNG1 protein [Rosellinia necatrix]
MMPNFLRPQTFPYASSSTGPYRGLLVRKYPCWDARGPARDLFMGEIAGKIKECLEQCLLESNSFVGFSLFMVGKLPEKTKPTIMIVSDDKIRRKAAFQTIKSRNIMSSYPGFEIGHCSVAAEFEDLRPLGLSTASSDASSASLTASFDPGPSSDHCSELEEDEEEEVEEEGEPGMDILTLLSTEVCAFGFPRGTEPTRLHFHTSPKLHLHSQDSASATCGGLFRFENGIYTLTMAHAILPARHTTASPKPAASEESSSSDDFEITGMDDWDDDDGDVKTLTAITSPGSRSASEFSDSEESLLRCYDSQMSSEIGTRTRRSTGPPIIYQEDSDLDGDIYAQENEDEDEGEDDEEEDGIEGCEWVGSVVAVDQILDIAVIKITPGISATGPSYVSPGMVMDINHYLRADSPANGGSNDTSIVIKTIHRSRHRGQRSLTPFYTRLPGTSTFLELFSANVHAPIRQGGSGSWAFNEAGELVGFVIAGNLETGSCLLLPAKSALTSIYSLLLSREEPVRVRPPIALSQAASPAVMFGSMRDDDDATVASSVPPPSIFSYRMDRGTSSTSALSTIAASHEHEPENWYTRRSLPRGDAGQTGYFASKGNFLEDQIARLRRELERAWEIIKEKDEQLQRFITRDARYNPGDKDDQQSGLKALQREMETNRGLIEEARAMWREQVTANEVLNQENKELRKGISKAIEETNQVHEVTKKTHDPGEVAKIFPFTPITVSSDDRLLKITTNLEYVLFDNSAKDKVKPEFEKSSRSALMSIPPFPGPGIAPRSGDTTPQLSALVTPTPIPRTPIPRTPKEERRILTPRSRLKSLPMTLKGQSPSLSDIGKGIETVVEVDEEDDEINEISETGKPTTTGPIASKSSAQIRPFDSGDLLRAIVLDDPVNVDARTPRLTARNDSWEEVRDRDKDG